jgi:hypothetical protein
MEDQAQRQYRLKDITHDLAVLLNDDSLCILPMIGKGGAQDMRDVAMYCT